MSDLYGGNDPCSLVALDLQLDLPRCLRDRWPDALRKAFCDPFEYALGLRDGTVIQFEECKFDQEGEWVRLKGVSSVVNNPALDSLVLTRGLEIALREIAWVVDAPNGS